MVAMLRHLADRRHGPDEALRGMVATARGLSTLGTALASLRMVDRQSPGSRDEAEPGSTHSIWGNP
jgi:hypothetical protein